MKLNNSQYDTLMRMYDLKQTKSRNELSARYKEVCEKLPEYDELCQRCVTLSAEAARKSLFGDKAAKEKLSEQLAEIKEEKLVLLSAAGYPSDYLELAFECDKCKDTGFIKNEKCTCFKQAAIDLLYNQSNLKKILTLENFDNFNYDWYSEDIKDSVTGLSAMENILNVTNDISGFIEDFPSARNLLFYGDTGVGKTYLTHCIVKALLDKGYSVLYLTAIDLFDIFSKYAFDNDNEADYREAFSQILDCDLLIIDDLGTELANSFTNSRLFYCINERIILEHSTIISTNLDLQGLMNAYSERIFSRITMSYNIYKIFGEDIRLKQI